jgi:hypothetical protein
MTEQIKTRTPDATAIKPQDEDLSEAIRQTVKKLPGEEVKSVRVFGNCYRCNWWVQDQAAGATFCLPVGKISRSSFLRATRSGDQVVIEDLTGR